MATAAAALVFTTACGSAEPGDGGSEPGLSTARLDDEVVERSWCGLAITYLEDDLPEVVSSDRPADVAARYRQQYFGEGAAELEESLALAPPEISTDVMVVVAGLREAAETGTSTAVTTSDFREAKVRIDAYNSASCSTFSDGGDGSAT